MMNARGIKFLCVCSLLVLLAPSRVLAQNTVRIIEPDDQTRAADVAAIDTERFELGAYTGVLSVEDFGSEAVLGLEFAFHLNERWMLLANYGKASIGKASFEGDPGFLASADRDFEYYGVLGGFKLFPGRSFFGAKKKYQTGLYVLAGPDHVSFAANDSWGLAFGLSYRVVLTDWLTGSIDFREHLFKRDFIGDDKQTLNTEFKIGVNALF
ncbi:outer membrane beta-barrel domain-containing protein [Aurantivibrio plasticivorans]